MKDKILAYILAGFVSSVIIIGSVLAYISLKGGGFTTSGWLSLIQGALAIILIYAYGGHIFLLLGNKILLFIRVKSAGSERNFLALSYFVGFTTFLTGIVVTNLICGSMTMNNAWSFAIAFCIMTFAASMSAIVFARFYTLAR